jgi:uncharacterized protein (TIGR03083 family)
VPTQLTATRHLDGLREAMLAFVRYGDRAGLSAAVPTCPGWTVRELVAHQGMVHRWAAANLRGRSADPDQLERSGLAAPDPLEWLADGAIDLATAWAKAPVDVRTVVFLEDAPGPKQFWARRQCHETTIHAVDALSAVLGRYPRSADTWIGRDLALDGIDELLTGFVPRPRSRLRADEPITIAVLPDDADERWLVAVSPQAPVTARGLGDDDADVVLRGSAVALYLTLWKRSDEVSDDSLDLWAEGARVTWG